METMGSSRSRRLKLDGKDIEGGDVLSNLPESILHYILSFLDMKYVVQTSILSRKWRYLWISHPTINLDTEVFDCHRRTHVFQNFVDQLLILRDNSNIKAFNLICNEGCDVTSRLNTWILAALRRNVQILYVEIHADQTFAFPSCLFTCKWLTKLIFKTRGVEYSKIILPYSVDLPVLRILHLESILFDNEYFTNKFISSCPALESLEIENGEFSSVNLNIYSLKLTELKLETFEMCEGYLNPVVTKVNLYAPNLLWLCCKDYMSKDYCLGNLSSLVTAYIDMEIEGHHKYPGRYAELPTEMKDLCLQRMTKLLRALYSVKHLNLFPRLIEAVSGASDLLDAQATEFYSLRSLSIDTWLSRDCIHGIAYLLKISPNIQTLSLKIHVVECLRTHPMYPYYDEIKSNSLNIEDYWEAGMLFKFMMCHLKYVKIIGFEGRVNELKFMEILLRHAMALEEVVISTCMKANEVGHMVKFNEKLLKLPRASKSVAFLVY